MIRNHSPSTVVRRATLWMALLSVLLTTRALVAENVIEKQLAEIGSIPNDEIVVVQRKYTRKRFRSEFTPVMFGGVPFGTVRKTLVGGAGYTLHLGDKFAWEALNFVYTKTFFTGFTSDINTGQDASSRPRINVDYQKLLYFMTTGFQYTPFYGKIATFSRYIAYVEPYISLGIGVARTETNHYITGIPGVGLRIFFKEWFSMRLELRDYIYQEKFLTRTSPAEEATAIRNNYAVMLSLSFWLPKMPST